MTSDLSLRSATEDDIPLLLELWRDTMSPSFLALGILPAVEQPLHRILMRFECAEMVILEDIPIGLFKVARDGGDWKLIQVLLSPAVQGRGIGTHLIANLIAEANSSSASLSLSVLKGNPALKLYLRFGFVIEGEEEHALNMHLLANPAVEGTLRDKAAHRPSL
jgi:ribosomal protein S18 acetylase RimI-like enzyme